MTKARQPVKALNKDANTVAANAAAEKARKAASRAALKASKATVAAEAKADEAEIAHFHAGTRGAESEATGPVDHTTEYTANALKAAQVDADATGQTLEAVLTEMGLDAEGKPLTPVDSKARYDGPMLALRTAALTYVKAANGQPCNGDPLALVCGAHPREVVVASLIKAMGLESNPYAHLNPGQQSMNLRNKARGQIGKGLLTIEAVKAVFPA